MRGLVIKSTGANYLVNIDGEIFSCSLKGKIRLEGRKTTNPVAVGDFVWVEKTNQAEYNISNIEPRRNYIIRKSINLSKQAQIIASNLDQVFVLASMFAPRTSLGFIDRILITAEAYQIPAKIIFNKYDLLDEESKKIQTEIINIYTQAGYDCFEISVQEKINLKFIEQLLEAKTTLITGHSGVGKTSLLNYLIPNLNMKVSQISAAHLKGTHTTTFAELFELSNGGKIIDTPGIKELGVVEMKKEEVGHYFPEIRNLMNKCKFNNCLHVNEPQCAVIKALELGEVSQERYYSYLGILNGEEMDWKACEL
jgi:ribosome biogenesis GTPase